MQICKVLKAGSPGLPEPKPRRMLVLCKQVVGEGLSTRGVVLRAGSRHHLSVAAGGDKKRTKRGHGRDKEGMSHLSQHFLGCLWLLPLQPLPREQRAAANRGGSGVTVSGVWAGGGPLGLGAALWGCGRARGVLGEGFVLGCSYKSSPCARGFGAGSNPEVRLELSQLLSTRSAATWAVLGLLVLGGGITGAERGLWDPLCPTPARRAAAPGRLCSLEQL